jgi:NDP-sugar pyrophosphorylase family protein
MAPVLGRPLIARVLDTIASADIRDLIIVVGAEDREIRDFLDQRVQPADRVRCVVQHDRLGMAHALHCAAPLLAGEEFLLSSCDSLTVPETVAALVRTHRKTGPAATLAVMDVAPEAVTRSAAVEVQESWIRRIVEKAPPGEAPSTTISLPLYVCSPGILELLPDVEPSPRGEYELADVFQLLIDRGGKVALHRTDWRLQVSTPEDLLALNLHYLRRDRSRIHGRPDSIDATSRVEAPVVMGPGVRIGAGCRIGPRVYLEGPCEVEDDVQVRDAVVLRHVTIGRGSRVCGKIVWAEPSNRRP